MARMISLAPSLRIDHYSAAIASAIALRTPEHVPPHLYVLYSPRRTLVTVPESQ